MTGKIMLETPRLLLREFLPEDAAGFFELNNDPEVLQYTGDDPFRDPAEAAAFIATYDQYQRYGYGRWTVLRKTDNAYLGFCGLRYSPELNETDLGFRIRRADWNRGYATEAARACVDHAFRELGLYRLVGRARRENAASIRVLEKLGFQYWKDFSFDGHPGVYYQLTWPSS